MRASALRSSILQRRIPGLTPPGSPDYSAFPATCSLAHKLSRSLALWERAGVRASDPPSSSPPSRSPRLPLAHLAWPQKTSSPPRFVSVAHFVPLAHQIPHADFPRPLGEGKGEGIRFRSSILQRRIPGLTPPGSPDYSAFLATCSLAHKLSGSLSLWESARVRAFDLRSSAPKNSPPFARGGPRGGRVASFTGSPSPLPTDNNCPLSTV